jgi:hypothetical protein
MGSRRALPMRTVVIGAFLIFGLAAHSLRAQPPPAAKKQTTSKTVTGKAAGTTSATVKPSGGSASVSRSWVDKGSKVPTLNSKGNDVALEEMHVAAPNIEIVPGTTSKDSTRKKSPK